MSIAAHAFTGALVAVSALISSILPAQAEVSFKGKTVTMIVGSEPGGGTDATGRVVANFLHKYLPGEPAVVVQNMPGAGGIVSVNYLVRRTQPDGLTIEMATQTVFDPVTARANPNVQYDPKKLRIVGGIGRGGTIIFINAEAKPRLLDRSQPPLVIGSADPLPRAAMQPALWCIEYLGWNARWVTGYSGTNQVMLAFDRGEVDMTSTGNIFEIDDRLKSGKLLILNQSGMFVNGRNIGRPQFGDAPLFTDQMREKVSDPVALRALDYWSALSTADKWMGLAPGTPDDILAAYRDAFARASEDKDFIEMGSKVSDGFIPMSGADYEGLVNTLVDTPEAALNFAKGLMRKQGPHVP
jgi:hypothetical protein